MTIFDEVPQTFVHDGILFVRALDNDSVFVASKGLDDAGYVTVGEDGVRVYSDAKDYELVAVLRPDLDDNQFADDEQRDEALKHAANALNAAITISRETVDA